eukprot:133134-Hanusia_phi.AAC.2
MLDPQSCCCSGAGEPTLRAWTEGNRGPGGMHKKYYDLKTQLGFSLRLGIDGIYYVDEVSDSSLLKGNMRAGDILHSIDGQAVTSRPASVISKLLRPNQESRKILALLGSSTDKTLLFSALNEFSSWRAVIVEPARSGVRKKSNADILIDIATEEECLVDLQLHPSSFSQPVKTDDQKRSVLFSLLTAEIAGLLPTSTIHISILELLPDARRAVVELRQLIHEGEDPIELAAERMVSAINNRQPSASSSSSLPHFRLISSASLRVIAKRRRSSAMSRRESAIQQNMQEEGLVQSREGREILSDSQLGASSGLLGVGLALYWDEVSSLPRVDEFCPSVAGPGKGLIRVNDAILEVDGMCTRGQGLVRVMMWIAGEERRRVELRVLRGESFCGTRRRERKKLTLSVMRGSGEVVEVQEEEERIAEGERAREGEMPQTAKMNGYAHMGAEGIRANGERDFAQMSAEQREDGTNEEHEKQISGLVRPVSTVRPCLTAVVSKLLIDFIKTVDGLQIDEAFDDIPDVPLADMAQEKPRDDSIFNHPPPDLGKVP